MKDVAGAWLAMQCKLMPSASRGMVFLGEPDRGPFSAVAHWPEGTGDSDALSEAAELAMVDRHGVLRAPHDEDGRSSGKDRDAVALPLVIDGALWGSVAFEVPHRPKGQQQSIIEQLVSGCAWLALLLRQRTPTRPEDALTVLEFVAACLDQEHFESASSAIATGLATRLDFERVSIGFRKRAHTELQAVSHSAEFGKKAVFVRQIEAAMDEAIDQESVIASPPLAAAAPSTTRAHDEAKRRLGVASVCTIPFSSDGRIVGAVTLERAEPGFDPDLLAVCEQVAAMAGAVLDLRRRDGEGLPSRVAGSCRAGLAELVGPKHLGAKLCAAAFASAFLILAVTPGDYRVRADATLEGTVRRVVVAAMDGFVVEEHARAGDVVRKGQVLAALDDRDLELERVKWSSQRDQALTEHRESLAHRNWTKVNILSAQLGQADARLALVDEQLARTKLVAPFDGIIVKGDLSQSLGSPVERGELFFEIAPLDSYRIMLEVDEREIGEVAVDQRGSLTLSSMPDETFGLVVQRITPIATAEEGRNTFRVEASLEEPVALLRPGMQGVAKIDIDRRSLLWIFTHELRDRARLWLWTWWP